MGPMRMMLTSKTKIHLIRSLHSRRGMKRAFTLVELMIVVAIVGVLSAVVVPAYLNARSAAAAGAVVGEAIGFAKECATAAASDVDSGITTGSTNVTVACSTAGGTVSTTFEAGASGIQCLTDSSVALDNSATITISDAGVTTCLFS
jgi:type IV pilus assembly protein PilA